MSEIQAFVSWDLRHTCVSKNWTLGFGFKTFHTSVWNLSLKVRISDTFWKKVSENQTVIQCLKSILHVVQISDTHCNIQRLMFGTKISE